MNLYPFLFQPILRTMVWGGSQLRPYKGLEPSEEPIGESWEVSTYPTLPSVISNGSFADKQLKELIDQYPDDILGKAVNKKYKGQFPLLVKFIDAQTDLSIQVHPNDEMAMREHGMMGKSEMWYVIKADEESHLYLGFKKEITPEEYQQRIKDGTITEVLADHKVKPGDVFSIPAGRIHALCGGIMVAEVQQSSDLTYRIYDYNRLGIDGKPRELHTELAAKALNYRVESNYKLEYQDRINQAINIIDSPHFNVRILYLTEPMHRDLMKYDSFIISMCIKGDCKIRIRKTGDEVILKEGYSTLIPASIADYDVIPLGNHAKILDSYIDNMGKVSFRSFKRCIRRRRSFKKTLI